MRQMSSYLLSFFKIIKFFFKHQNIINEGCVEEFVNIMKMPLNSTFYISTYSKYGLIFAMCDANCNAKSFKILDMQRG